MLVHNLPFPTSCPPQMVPGLHQCHDSSQPRQEQHTLTEWPSAVSETVGWYCPRGSRTCLNMLCRYTLIILGRSIRSFWVLFSVTCPVSNSTTPTYTSCAQFFVNPVGYKSQCRHFKTGSPELHHPLKRGDDYDKAHHHRSQPEAHLPACVW